MKQKKKEVRSAVEVMQNFLRYLLSALVTLYMVLLIGVMPFYNTEGFARIGTDKSVFFTKTAVILGKIAIFAVVCYGITCAVRYFRGKKMLQPGSKKTFLSVTDIFAGLYAISLIISYACSDYKEAVLWGASGWYMGLWPQLLLIGSYFLISRFGSLHKWLFYLIFPVSGMVFILGILNRFGIFPIDMQIENVQFISTIGNINWYCGYLVTVFFGGVFLWWLEGGQPVEGRRLKKQEVKAGKSRIGYIFLTVYVALGFGTLVTQGSSSGLFTLTVMSFILFFLSARKQELMLRFWRLMTLLWCVCLSVFGVRLLFPESLTYRDTAGDIFTYSVLPIVMTIVSFGIHFFLKRVSVRKGYPEKCFRILAWAAVGGVLSAGIVFVVLLIVNTLYPGSLGTLSEIPFLTFSPLWGSRRGSTWRAGMMCFAEQDFLHKLVGIGPDGMSAFLYQNGSEELIALVKEAFGNATLTNAHNEWLTVLVNTGLFGLVCYVGMIVSAVIRYVKNRNASAIAGAAGFCMLAYTVNNMFSFQQAMNVSVLFLIFGMGEAFLRRRAELEM